MAILDHDHEPFIAMIRLGHVVLLFCAGTMPRPGAVEMAFPGADWNEVPPESQQVDPARLAAAVEFLKSKAGNDGARELLIIRNGRLLWKGDNIDKVHGIWSGTKSFTSTALGLLIEDGRCTLDTRAATVHPELAAHYPDVTLRHFATMTSGYRAVGDEPRGSYRHGPSRTPFLPDTAPLFAPPGSRVWPGAPPGVFAAAGHNNNRCFVIPEWQMVVVRLGLDEGERKITDAEWGGFLRLIGVAAGWAESP